MARAPRAHATWPDAFPPPPARRRDPLEGWPFDGTASPGARLAPGRWPGRVRAGAAAASDQGHGAIRSGGAAGSAAPIERYLDEVPIREQDTLRAELEVIAADYARGREGETTAPWTAPESVRLAPGSMFGPYRIEEWIGGGGMGDVYRGARHPRPPPRRRPEGAAPRRRHDRRPDPAFRAEKRVNGRLNHKGIVQSYDVGEDRGRHYLVLELLAGGSLSDRVKTGTLPDREAADLLAQVASAVGHGHLRGIIHRDLKPSNILLDAEGRPHVSDYGLARLLGADDDLTMQGTLLGTVSYMPPEQARDPGGVRETADVYSLGATLYCLLTGRPPFQSPDLHATLRQVLDVDPVPPRRLNPTISLDMEAVCLKCLEKDPGRRFADAEELAEELRRVERDEPTRTRPLSWAGRLVRWSRRRPTVAALSASLLTLAAVSFTAVTLLGLWAERGRRGLERNDYFKGLALAAEALAPGARIARPGSWPTARDRCAAGNGGCCAAGSRSRRRSSTAPTTSPARWPSGPIRRP